MELTENEKFLINELIVRQLRNYQNVNLKGLRKLTGRNYTKHEKDLIKLLNKLSK